MKIFISGAAGFIGFHLTNLLANQGHEILGFDNINDYYDINLKYSRLAQLGIEKEHISEKVVIKSKTFSNLQFIKADLQDKSLVMKCFADFKPDIVCNLAAQAGVRYSFENPYTYIESNVLGFLTILEACRAFPVQHLLYASSSSVYGLNKNIPFSVNDKNDSPISLYAATKKSNELMAHTYSYLFNIPSTGLRFFTVYGPWGRPDMALFKFTKSILAHSPIEVYNQGNMFRDFTYIDDIVHAIVKLIPQVPVEQNQPWTTAPFRILNIGNGSPVNLMDFVHAIEQELGIEAIINYLPLQPGDVVSTHADTSQLYELIGFKPQTSIKEGIHQFITWYKQHYKQ
ncbi:MAG: NAD-dependent epimerase [Bacteroidales bacterium]|jgi:UDP-glucuronate 4-epimerase|nr:NAD-dependent epimerase [Bacteroidales bacterium]HNV95297.1 NAD-dependent epimerase [Bacteroidales bacterium]